TTLFSRECASLSKHFSINGELSLSAASYGKFLGWKNIKKIEPGPAQLLKRTAPGFSFWTLGKTYTSISAFV
ncbi:MAG: hypothetical protein Q8933_20600, partial [Bacteroidota bacterium]|nr:hypothetical protein [Bacteroidota bacterium]